MSTIQEKRKQKEVLGREKTETTTGCDMLEIRTNVEKAYKQLSDGISKWNKDGNYARIKIGNRHSNLKDIEAIVESYNNEISELGYDGQIIAKMDYFSNVGDPYYMGGNDDIISYFVKISEV